MEVRVLTAFFFSAFVDPSLDNFLFGFNSLSKSVSVFFLRSLLLLLSKSDFTCFFGSGYTAIVMVFLTFVFTLLTSLLNKNESFNISTFISINYIKIFKPLPLIS